MAQCKNCGSPSDESMPCKACWDLLLAIKSFGHDGCRLCVSQSQQILIVEKCKPTTPTGEWP